MSISVHEPEAQVLSLRAEDRAHLLDLLIESFEPDSGIQAAWVAEAVRRRDEVRSGRVEPIPGEEVIARVRQALAGEVPIPPRSAC